MSRRKESFLADRSMEEKAVGRDQQKQKARGRRSSARIGSVLGGQRDPDRVLVAAPRPAIDTGQSGL